MPRVIRLVIDVTLEDLSDERREELAEAASEDVEELPKMSEIAGWEVADTIEAYIIGEDGQDMWAGSDMYAKITAAKFIEQLSDITT